MPTRDPIKLRAKRLREYTKANARRRKWIGDYKRGKSCAFCGLSFADCPECLDFHHTDPSTKEARIANLQTQKAFMAEVVKCIPLCANCHRTAHARLRSIVP